MLRKQPESFQRRVLKGSRREITASRQAFGSQISAGSIPAFPLAFSMALTTCTGLFDGIKR
jgi:hypothetical protein